MKLKVSELTTERKWRAATGMDQAQFEKWLKRFQTSYKQIYRKSIEHKQASEKRFEWVIKTEKSFKYKNLNLKY